MIKTIGFIFLGYLSGSVLYARIFAALFKKDNMIENSKAKLVKKNIDMIIANNLKQSGAGFGTDTNVVTIITKDEEEQLEIMTKEEVANRILDEIMAKMK